MLKKQIDDNSQKPNELPKETLEDELELDGVKLELNKQSDTERQD